MCEMLTNRHSQVSLTAVVLDTLGGIQLPAVEAVQLRAKISKRVADVPFDKLPALLAIIFNEQAGSEEFLPLIREVRVNFDYACIRDRERASFREDTQKKTLSVVVKSLENLIRSQVFDDSWFNGI